MRGTLEGQTPRLNKKWLDRATLKLIIHDLLVLGMPERRVAEKHGVNPSLAGRIRRGCGYHEERAEIIKELRAEGHAVVLPIERVPKIKPKAKQRRVESNY